MRATARTTVHAPIEAVWTYVSTVEHMGEWVDGVSDVRRSATGPLSTGEQFSSAYAYRGETFEVTYEVAAVEPPRRLDLVSTEGPFPFEASLRLAEVPGGTEVANTLTAGSDSRATSLIFALFGPVVRWLMRRQLAGELERLADRVAGVETAEPAA